MSTYAAESINQTTECRTIHPRRPLSTVYKTVQNVLYAVDEGLHGLNILQSVVRLIDSATYLLIKVDSLESATLRVDE